MSKKNKAPKVIEPVQPTKRMISEYVGNFELPVRLDLYYDINVDELIENLKEAINLLQQKQIEAKQTGLNEVSISSGDDHSGDYALSGERIETDEEFAYRLEIEQERREAAAEYEARQREDLRQAQLRQKSSVLEAVQDLAATMTQDELLAAWRKGKKP